MRAKVAKAANGHVYEERFTKLSGLQLVIAYKQALKDEQEQFELIKTVNTSWAKRFDDLFKALYMFTNPELYTAYEDTKDLELHRNDVKPEEFQNVWEEIMQVIPEQVIVTEADEEQTSIPDIDPEFEEILAGFIPYRMRRDGE